MQNKDIKRVSTRAFSDVPMSATAISLVKSILLKSNPGIFGHVYNIRLIQDDFIKKNRIKRLGTYGVVSGKPAYMFSVSSKKKYALIDYAYCLENLILELTDSGIDSIWLGGSSKKRKFKKLFNLKENDTIPAIVAIGNGKISLAPQEQKESSNKRMPFGELFFDEVLGRPLSFENAGEFGDVLEAVRIGPSYKNLQPWTVIQEKGEHLKYHFYIKSQKFMEQKYTDIGIALSHFDYMRKAKKLKGHYKTIDGLDIPDYEYVATFIAV